MSFVWIATNIDFAPLFTDERADEFSDENENPLAAQVHRWREFRPTPGP